MASASSPASDAAGGPDIPFNPYTLPQTDDEVRPPAYVPSGEPGPALGAVESLPTPDALPTPAPAPQPPDPSEGLDGGYTRPPNVRKESSVTFFNAGAGGNDWGSSRVLRESPSVTEGLGWSEGSDIATLPATNSPRVLRGRQGAPGDSRSMYSVSSSAVTTVADAQTPYVNMLMALDRIHWVNEAFSIAFCWLLLAGFVVMPQALAKTIPEFVESSAENLADGWKMIAIEIQDRLYYIAGGISGVGLLGILILWWQWRGNYMWITQKLFIPGFFNGLVGSISTMISIFLINKGKWDTLSIATMGVVGGVTVGSGIIALTYTFSNR
ncbi:hypothetical protein FA13DRAFT_1735058, partial [Coprinellus micaceus]